MVIAVAGVLTAQLFDHALDEAVELERATGKVLRASRDLQQEGMPERVYAMHLGHAALYMYECGPERKVFADPRLEVNTQETLAHYLEIVVLLAAKEEADAQAQ